MAFANEVFHAQPHATRSALSRLCDFAWACGRCGGAGIQAESREYKLALEPAKFDFKEPQKTVGEFWVKLTGIIDTALGKGAGGKPRFADTSFDEFQATADRVS